MRRRQESSSNSLNRDSVLSVVEKHVPEAHSLASNSISSSDYLCDLGYRFSLSVPPGFLTYKMRVIMVPQGLW